MKRIFIIVWLCALTLVNTAAAQDVSSTPIGVDTPSCARGADQVLNVRVSDSLPAGSFLQELTISAGSFGQVYYGSNVVQGPLSGEHIIQARITTGYSLEDGTPIRVTLTTYATDRRTSPVTAARTLVYNCSTGEIRESGDAPFLDGRINQHQEASAAVYCGSSGAITIFSIDARGRGEFLFTTTPRELGRFPANPDVNTVLEQVTGPRGPIQLWRLNGGMLQVVSPGQAGDNEKNYDFIFSGCSGQNIR
jgi:hypothetical protein